MARKYELKERATSMAHTRERIVDATIELHSSVGPTRTTIAQIAARAGVQRHTVYKHFSSQQDLLAACSRRYWERNPWPPVEDWAGVRDEAALADRLEQLYDYYERNQGVLGNSLKDAGDDDNVAAALRPYRDYIDALLSLLSSALASPETDAELLRVIVCHALAFETWHQLRQAAGASNSQAARLMATSVFVAPRGG